MLAAESRRDIFHEARHLVLHLGVRLESNIEIEDDLLESGSFDFLQRLRYLSWRTEQHGVLSKILGLHVSQPVDHVDEISVAWRYGFPIAGQSGNCAFLVGA